MPVISANGELASLPTAVFKPVKEEAIEVNGPFAKAVYKNTYQPVTGVVEFDRGEELFQKKHMFKAWFLNGKSLGITIEYLDGEVRSINKRNDHFFFEWDYRLGQVHYYVDEPLLAIPDEKKMGWRYIPHYIDKIVDGRKCSLFWPKEWFTVNNGTVTEYYDSGEIVEEKYYVGGKLDGEVITFYESGMLCSVIRYIDGREHGPWVSFHENGVERFRGHYINKEACGLWEEFDEEGRRVASNFYGNGSLV